LDDIILTPKPYHLPVSSAIAFTDCQFAINAIGPYFNILSKITSKIIVFTVI
jgi:hypothetical protein